ncbi:MAG: cytochrome C [Meiothermus sp.]|nr:cytochrome C [Meiothermus sp.]
MYRNDRIVPAAALVFAFALFFMAYLNTQTRVVEKVLEGAPPAMSVGTKGLLVFAFVLFIYGFIGLMSNWLEGSEFRPGVHTPEPSSLPVIAGIVLSLMLVVLSGVFVRTLLPITPAEGDPYYAPAWLQGGVFGAMMLILAFLIAIYKKFFQVEEVLAEDEKGDFPW